MGCSSRLFQRSAKAFINLNRKNKGASNTSCGLPHTIPSPYRPFLNKPFSSRLPVQLASGESLMPLHTATASSLLRSMLSSKVGQWGSLSEGFATPL